MHNNKQHPFTSQLSFSAFSAFCVLTLLVGRQEGHLPVKKLSGGMLVWLSVWARTDLHMPS